METIEDKKIIGDSQTVSKEHEIIDRIINSMLGDIDENIDKLLDITNVTDAVNRCMLKGMIQSKLVDSLQWLPYPGFYDKQWYDVKAKDGTILLGVRPNAGKFKSDDITILEEDVVAYRLPKGEWLNQ